LFVAGVSDITAVNLNVETDDFGIDSFISAEIKNTLEDQFSVTFTTQQKYGLVASTLREQYATCST
jgi:acyl carrier protein